MASAPARRNLPRHVIAIVAGAAVLLVSVWQISLLYTEAAPFHQRYAAATDVENIAVTRRIGIALLGPPVGVSLLCAAAMGSAIARSRRICLLAIAAALLLTALHGCYIRWHLPYGFGSSYEHASSDQRVHLALAGTGSIAAFGLAVVLLGLSIAIGRRKT